MKKKSRNCLSLCPSIHSCSPTFLVLTHFLYYFFSYWSHLIVMCLKGLLLVFDISETCIIEFNK